MRKTSFSLFDSGVNLTVLGFEVEARRLYGRELGDWTPYMSQLIIGRLRLHVFHRGDADPDPHDHPWDFWTFPLHSYLEEVTVPDPPRGQYHREVNLVTAFHWHHRPATYTHRVLCRGSERTGALALPGPIITIVWTAPKSRSWGFLKQRDGRWCWQAWKDYVLKGGKNAPCADE